MNGLSKISYHYGLGMLQVFQIVTPDRNTNGKILPSLKAGSACRNLFQWYPVITLDDVLASNAWYKTFPTAPWYTENMSLTYEYLENHMEHSLFHMVNEEYRSYPSSSRGGPLLLFLMIRHLIASNSSVAESLSKQIDSVCISSYTGEDVGNVVTHLRGIIARLKNMRRKDQNGNEIDLVPFDLTKRLYRVFQTSSCEEFNSFFKDKSRHSLSKTGEGAWSDPEAVLALAESFYIDLNADNMWNGVDQNKATFPAISTPQDAVAFLSQVRCHNCGVSHYLRDCTAPKDQGRIAANKKILSKARKLAKKEGKQDSKDSTKDSKSTTSTSKWPPRPGRGENNRRTIDGKEYFYHFKKGKWLLVDPNHPNTTSNTQATNVADGTNSTRRTQSTESHGMSSVTDDSSTKSAQSRHVQIAIANMTQQFNELISQFNSLDE
jgi:hypothetical protein